MFLGVLAAGMIGLDGDGGTVAVPLLATHILWINLLTDAGPVASVSATNRVTPRSLAAAAKCSSRTVPIPHPGVRR